MKIDLKTTRSKIIFLIFAVASMTLVVFANADFIRQRRTHEVFIAIGKANEKRNGREVNPASAEEFIADLRSINTNYAVKGLKPAFAAYVEGLEEQLMLEKAGKDASAAHTKTEEAHDKLVEIAKAND